MELKCDFGKGIGKGILIVPDNFWEVYEKILNHHIKYVFPEVCAMLGVDIAKDKKYQKLLKKVKENDHKNRKRNQRRNSKNSQ